MCSGKESEIKVELTESLEILKTDIEKILSKKSNFVKNGFFVK